MWQTDYSAEATGYLADNGELVANLFRSIESLRLTEGIPNIGAMEIEPGLYYWLTDDHMVVYRKIAAHKVVRIISIKPDDL